MRYKLPIFILIALSQCAICRSQATSSQTTQKAIHPSFKLLLEMYPRKKDIVNPMVPRVHAKTAYNLYLKGQALFFAAGSVKQARFPGVILINEPNGLFFNPPLHLINQNQGKALLIYCH